MTIILSFSKIFVFHTNFCKFFLIKNKTSRPLYHFTKQGYMPIYLFSHGIYNNCNKSFFTQFSDSRAVIYVDAERTDKVQYIIGQGRILSCGV